MRRHEARRQSLSTVKSAHATWRHNAADNLSNAGTSSSRADWHRGNAARLQLADFFQDTQNVTGIFGNQSSAGASSSDVPSLQPTPTSAP